LFLSNIHLEGDTGVPAKPPAMILADQIHADFQSHARFCQQSLMVETEARTVVRMVLSPGQLRLRQAIEKQRRRGQPVRIIYLKSRRIQATTGTGEFPDFHQLSLWVANIPVGGQNLVGL
jgi:hypothetical protein